MVKSEQEIIDDINMHIKRCGGSYNAWYIGISKDALDRLLNGHKVKEKKDAWIYRKASSSEVARDIEGHFISTLGTDGETGGGDDKTNMVYAYKKSAHTNP
ncbi:hypothetical protein ES703_100362 [subsurface metagenome]